MLPFIIHNFQSVFNLSDRVNAFGHWTQRNLPPIRSTRRIAPSASVRLTHLWQTLRKWLLHFILVLNTSLHTVQLYVDDISTLSSCSDLVIVAWSYDGRKIWAWEWQFILWRILPNPEHSWYELKLLWRMTPWHNSKTNGIIFIKYGWLVVC